ncbi:MAG: WYL domain-containing protein [Gordonia sp. (in: high G+C Gram-positive bacteria)]|uniref:helix-turn-helix transcriptional regulator n=1 Tax=Gordonia sp. (in: high G+C Gram-positive bacteria) TaxID=84139 RepID=UPI0039E61756
MRADRLISLVLLLRQRGRMTADALAAELEVSTRTVLRDIDALSTAGVPVYAERGRYGGFALLPGFHTELTGLNHDEALALLTAGAGITAFGLGGALSSAMRKVVDALPAENRATAGERVTRLLVEPEADLLSRRTAVEEIDADVMGQVRSTVLNGRKLRFHYAAPDKAPRWHTVDPIGLVAVRGRLYLLARKSGEDRTYRVARMLSAVGLPESAERPARVDLDELWRERSAAFLSSGHIEVTVRLDPARREELYEAASAVRLVETEADGWLRLQVELEDLRHAVWVAWQLDTAIEVLHPPELRAALSERAEVLAARYRRGAKTE